jgi:magnesium-transporting ATPase (P-type)
MSNFLKATPKQYRILGYLSFVCTTVFFIFGAVFVEMPNPYLVISLVLAIICFYCFWQIDENEELLSEFEKSLREHKKVLKNKETGKSEIEEKIMSNFSQKVPSKHELKAMRKRDEKGRFV